MKMWGGRMSGPPDARAERLNASASFDIRLARQDLAGSRAWARALARAGVLSADEAQALQAGLAEIEQLVERGAFAAQLTDEDIHSAFERALLERIGPLAGKLHTGRSRNDQVATDLRLWVMECVPEIARGVLELQQALVDSAEQGLSEPMPGYTHLRQAQPVTWGHWALSHFWPLTRDVERLGGAAAAAAASLPLGAGALAGTAYPIDRQALADELGFAGLAANSIDAVSDRDFAVVMLFACALLGVHLSCMAEQLIVFSTAEFGFVELDEAFTTGSSLMPHKRNPDVLELARGKSGRLIGGLTGLMAALKGLPSAYDKDLQEDKEPVFDAYDTLSLLLPALTGLVETLRPQPERMRAAISPEALAVDLADRLAARGLPFRAAHELVGRALRHAEARGLRLDQLGPDDWRALGVEPEEDLEATFDISAALERRAAGGGTARAALLEQAAAARAWLAGRAAPPG